MKYLQCVHGIVEVGDLELARLPLSFRQARPDGVFQYGVVAVQKDLTLSTDGRTRVPYRTAGRQEPITR